MDDSASTAEQGHYAQRLVAAGERLQRRADEAVGTIIEGEVLANGPLTLPAHMSAAAEDDDVVPVRRR